MRVPVVIVGAGPVGLALANELNWRGVDFLLVDRMTAMLDFPTSEAVNTRTMEHFRRWGLSDRVRFSGFPPDLKRNVYFMTRILGHELARMDRPSNREQQAISHDFSPEGAVWCPKRLFDPVLRDNLPADKFLTGCEMTAFRQTADGVVLDLVQDGRTLQVECDYLAACDGASSGIRKTLGLAMQGNFAEGHNLGIYFRSTALRDVLATRPGVMADIINPEYNANLSAVDGDALWRLILFVREGDARALDPMACIRAALGSDLPVEIIDARPWAGHTVVADAFRRDRVFLVGDAAHLLWPRGGFGMNTGVGDAVDLGWKLDAVLAGWGGAGLLDAYEIERKPIARRNVTEAASNYRSESSLPVPAELEEDSEAGQAARMMLGQMIIAKRTKEWNSLGIQLGYSYAGSPIVCGDGTPEPPFDPSRYDQTTRPGARAPHVWLGDGTSLLDRFGRGFCLVHGRHAEPGAIVGAARAIGLPLTAVALETAAAEAVYERALVLVRPDGHVAWRGDAPPADIVGMLNQVRGMG